MCYINILGKTIDSFHRKLRNIYNSMFSYRGEAKKKMKLFVDHKLYLIKKNYSLFQVIVFVMFKGFKKKIHIPVNEEQLKSMKDEKSKNNSLTYMYYHFSFEKNQHIRKNLPFLTMKKITRNTSHNF